MLYQNFQKTVFMFIITIFIFNDISIRQLWFISIPVFRYFCGGHKFSHFFQYFLNSCQKKVHSFEDQKKECILPLITKRKYADKQLKSEFALLFIIIIISFHINVAAYNFFLEVSRFYNRHSLRYWQRTSYFIKIKYKRKNITLILLTNLHQGQILRFLQIHQIYFN